MEAIFAEIQWQYQPRAARLNVDGSFDGTFAVGTGFTGGFAPIVNDIKITLMASSSWRGISPHTMVTLVQMWLKLMAMEALIHSSIQEQQMALSTL